jgi:hypothetical protein
VSVSEFILQLSIFVLFVVAGKDAWPLGFGECSNCLISKRVFRPLQIAGISDQALDLDHDMWFLGAAYQESKAP